MERQSGKSTLVYLFVYLARQAKESSLGFLISWRRYFLQSGAWPEFIATPLANPHIAPWGGWKS